jgi:imidazolonepropionase-like amidohydrolase
MHWVTAALTLALGVFAFGSQSQTPPRAAVLRAAGLVDVRAGKTIAGAAVVVSGGRIVYAGAASGAPEKLPAGAEDIQLGKLILVPGFIDAHVHLALGGTPADNARATLGAGFTTVADLGAVDGSVLALRDEINAGRAVGPRVLAAGRWIGVSGGTCDFNGIGVRGAAAFRDRVDEEVRRGADLIKVCVSGWLADARRSPGTYEISDDELQAAISQAHTHKRRVVVHAISAAGIGKAVAMGADVVVHGGFVEPDTQRRMRERTVYMLPTLFSFTRGQAPEDVEALRAHLREAVRGGLPIAFGTDAGVIRHGNNGQEFEQLARLGLSPIEVLRTATVHAASALGMTNTIGVLEPGAFADIVGLDGDPLKDSSALQRVAFVMQRGVVVKGP